MAMRHSLIVLFVFLLPITALSANQYTVKKGDNLYDLALKFGVSVEDLKSVNDLENNRLDIGDVLIVPNSGGTAKNSYKEDDSNNKEYTVKKGDTLGGIAGRHGVSTAALQNENGLSSTKLQIGQKLVIPSGQSPTVKSAKTRQTTGEVSSEPVKSAASAVPATYTVKNGDTLGHIAAKFGMSSRELRAENGLKSDKLSIGQTLRIPGATPAAKSPEAAAPEVKAAAAPEAPRHAAPAGGAYIVEKGDTPGTIAQKLGVRTEDLIKLNNINSKSLQIGRKLVVPGTSGAVTAAADTAPVPVKAENTEAEKPAAKTEKVSAVTYYTVAKGDTPGGIAQKLGVSTKDLVELNSIDSKNLRIGQKLVVPGSVKPVETVKAAEPAAEAGKPAAFVDKSPEIPAVYTVQKGDTIYDLSRKFGLSADYIKKNNNLKNNNLRVGQKLALTSVETAESSADTVDPAVTAKFPGSYTVAKGDTLGRLALKYGVSQNELRKANGLKNSNIRIGQVLKVPGPVKKDVVVVAEPSVQQAEPVQAQPQEAASSSEVYIKKRYVVKEGDTLGGIAASFGVTVDEIKKASALKSDNIGKGNILLIPVPQERVTSSRYTVAKGDTLGKIGRKFGVSVKELKDANGLRSNTLRAGTKLNIPGITQSPSEPALEVGTKVVATASPRREHVVGKGDTLGSIAGKYGTTITSIRNENNIEGNSITVGQVLVIPTIPGQETAYVAVADKSTIQSNGSARAASESGEVKNGRFSKESIIQVAKKYLGTPYKFGGNDLITGIDCSGYVKKVFSRFNVNLPRTARDIYYRSGESVKKSELDTGDLVFFTTYAKFPSHVGIYIGNDEFIHASSASRKVTIDSINKQYYRKRYIGAKRVQLSGLFYDEMSRGYGGFEKN